MAERAILDMLSSSQKNTTSVSTDKPSSLRLNSKKEKKNVLVTKTTKRNNKRVRKIIMDVLSARIADIIC